MARLVRVRNKAARFAVRDVFLKRIERAVRPEGQLTPWDSSYSRLSVVSALVGGAKGDVVVQGERTYQGGLLRVGRSQQLTSWQNKGLL